MILYIENPKDATMKLLELINEFGKVAGYKLLHRIFWHSYTSTKVEQKEIKETIPPIITSKRIPRNKLTQGGKRLALG